VTNIQKPEGNFREFSLKNQGRADCEELLIDIKVGRRRKSSRFTKRPALVGSFEEQMIN
jgi:hypothetical protein